MIQQSLSLLDWRKLSENSASPLTSMRHISGTLEYLLPRIETSSLVAQLVKNPSTRRQTPVSFLDWGRPAGEGIVYLHQYSWVSLMAQMVKNVPAMWETWVRYLVWEDPLEKGMVTHSNILAWRIPMDRGAWWATIYGVTTTWTWLSD